MSLSHLYRRMIDAVKKGGPSRADPSSAVRLDHRIGQGAFGTVYRCTFRDTPMAAKVVNTSNLSKERVALLDNEIEVWRSIDHRNVCKLVHVDKTPTRCILVCELLGETLRERHVRMLRLGVKPKLITLVQGWMDVSEGLRHIHSLGIMHRDLKSENVLVSTASTDADLSPMDETLKLIDFGVAKRVVDSADHTAETGSYRWMAPEVIRHERYDKSCDIYSLAMLFYETLTFSLPFPSLSPVQAALSVATGANRPPLPPLPIAVERLIQECWDQCSENRPTIEDVVETLCTVKSMNMSFSALEMSQKLVRSASDAHLSAHVAHS